MIDFKMNPSALFTPGDKPDRFDKAQQVGAKVIIIDLEDAVAAEKKEYARQQVASYLASASENIIRLVRINHLGTTFALQDLLMLSQTSLHLDGIVHPKTESPEEINLMGEILKTSYPNLAMFALIESVLGVSNAVSIVKNSHQLEGLIFGAADYTLDLQCDDTPEALITTRQRLVQAASLKKIACYDSPYFDFHNPDGLEKETRVIKSYGFSGKAAIHPSQIVTINNLFKPVRHEYEKALEIIKAFEAANGAACQFEGKMIDIPIYKKAKNTLALFEHLSV